MFRVADEKDIAEVSEIYTHIHDEEAAGTIRTGWLRKVYPTQKTAADAVARGDLYVYEENGEILAAAIINNVQVDSYADGNWQYKVKDNEVLVLHTLVVEPSAGHRGIGADFVRFYEQQAKVSGCRCLRIDTNATNVRARAMYHKLGFREADIVPCIFNGIPGVQLVLLEKKV